jgi:hypothetical protein
MTEREFITQNGHAVRYSVGQPQGLKSSFHSMAFMHHVIVHLASIECGYTGFSSYAIVGDDIVLCDLKVVTQYKLIMKALGVDISEHKSLYHKEDSDISAAEFCSRIVVNGTELTGLSVHLLANTLSNPEFTIALWEDIMRKSIIARSSIYTFFAIFLRDADLERLALMNALPPSVSGMHFPVPATFWPAYDPAL